MGAGAYKARALVAQRRQLNLKHALPRCGPIGENFEDEASPVEQFDTPDFQVALLNWRDRPVNKDQFNVISLQLLFDFIEL